MTDRAKTTARPRSIAPTTRGVSRAANIDRTSARSGQMAAAIMTDRDMETTIKPTASAIEKR